MGFPSPASQIPQVELCASAHGSLLRRALPSSLGHENSTPPNFQTGSQVFDTFPLAILALEIRGREAGEQQARLAEALQDALPPVLHPGNFPLVKERHEFALREGGEVGLDALDKLGDAALLVVVARVGDEKVVGHGSIQRLRGCYTPVDYLGPRLLILLAPKNTMRPKTVAIRLN